MQTSTIYYSKKKALYSILKTLVGMGFGIYWMVNYTIDRQLYLGLVVFSVCGFISWNTYRKKYRNRVAIIEFSDKGIQTEEEFIEWKFIKKVFLRNNNDSDSKYLELSIEHTDADSLEDYWEEKKEIENGDYKLRQEEEYKKSLGVEKGSSEYSTMEQAVSPRFEAPVELKSDEIEQAEMYYYETTITLEDVDQTEEEIKGIISDFKKKVNKDLPNKSEKVY